MSKRRIAKVVFAISLAMALFSVAMAGDALAQDKKPNIVVIMGDDIGMWNIGAYHRGMMAGRTPNLDKIAKEGMLFTDYYAEASCTAGRANFITGELPIRTGMTTVGQAGAKIGIPAEAVTIATVLKSMGYATGQFGKNHLGDLNEFLPTAHGFDEFFGYLYHLDAMEDPAHPNYPQNLLNVVGPRNMVHSWATVTDDAMESAIFTGSPGPLRHPILAGHLYQGTTALSLENEGASETAGREGLETEVTSRDRSHRWSQVLPWFTLRTTICA